MPAERQADVIRRVSRLTELPAGSLEEVASALAAELPSGEAAMSLGVDGVARAAAILNASPREATTELLEAVGEFDLELSQTLRLAMFTFADLVRLEPKSMRGLLREIPTDRLTLALKNASDDVMRAVLGGLSTRAAEIIRDELELIGNPRKADIEAARREVIETALRLEAEGALDLARG